jgi:hypothetical protein
VEFLSVLEECSSLPNELLERTGGAGRLAFDRVGWVRVVRGRQWFPRPLSSKR